MLETTEIRRKGFAIRPTFADFVDKYACSQGSDSQNKNLCGEGNQPISLSLVSFRKRNPENEFEKFVVMWKRSEFVFSEWIKEEE